MEQPPHSPESMAFMSWFRSKPLASDPTSIPSERWGHSSTLWNGKLIIFGGYTSAESDSNGGSSSSGHCFNDLYILDLAATSWTKISPSGTLPAERWGHSAVVAGNKLLLFGGYASTRVEGNTFFKDFHILDLDLMEWFQPVITGTAPTERWGNSATLLGSTVWVFGGYSRSSVGVGRCFNDAYTLCLNTMTWSQPILSGPIPSERTGHSATVVGNSRIFIVGGASAGDHCYNDVYSLDTDSKCWSKPRCVLGKPPSERCGHLAGLLGNHIIVFGGVGAGDSGFRCLNDVHLLDLEAMTWTTPFLSGLPPSERWGHSATILGNTLHVVGGYANGGARRGPYCHDAFSLILDRSVVPSLTEMCIRYVRDKHLSFDKCTLSLLPSEISSRLDLVAL